MGEKIDGPQMVFTHLRESREEWNKHQLLYDYDATRRVIHLYGPVTGPQQRLDETACYVVMDTLFALDALSHDPIYLVIDTPGGSVWAGLALCDTMDTIHSPVYTIAREAYSMGAIILAAGEPGHRYVMPSSHLMLHLPAGQVQGDAREIADSAQDFERMKTMLVDRLIGWGVTKTHDEILTAIDRAKWLWAQDTIDFGLADAFMPRGLLSHPPKALPPALSDGVDDYEDEYKDAGFSGDESI